MAARKLSARVRANPLKPEPAPKPKLTKQEARRNAATTLERLQLAHPDAHCELVHRNAFELIVATVLSAQSTDVAVNKATPALFARWPTPAALANAPLEEVQAALSTIGMFRQKAKNIIGLAAKLLMHHAGQVPKTLDELIALPGVGRKTANVVLGVAFSSPEGVVVDTHVQRISQRLAWTKHSTVEKIEQDLMKRFPRDLWDALSHTLIFHGRRVCTAQRPACAACTITDACPSAFDAAHVGRKPARARQGGPASAKKGDAARHKSDAEERAAEKPATRKPGRRS